MAVVNRSIVSCFSFEFFFPMAFVVLLWLFSRLLTKRIYTRKWLIISVECRGWVNQRITTRGILLLFKLLWPPRSLLLIRRRLCLYSEHMRWLWLFASSATRKISVRSLGCQLKGLFRQARRLSIINHSLIGLCELISALNWRTTTTKLYLCYFHLRLFRG